MARPKLAVYKLASCDGCQLSLLDCEDELLDLAQLVHIANFPEATRAYEPGPYAVALVEGSVTTEHDRQRLLALRQEAQVLVTIGACATSGGVQALRNFADVSAFTSMVYAHPEYISTLAASTPVAAHVPVDFELRGCPVDKGQLVEVLLSLVLGRRPRTTPHSVCQACKRAGTVCVMVARGEPCLGPVTHAGCGALCPGYDRGCFGCFGPQDTPNVPSLADTWSRAGVTDPAIVRALSTYQAAAPPFAEEAARRAPQADDPPSPDPDSTEPLDV